MTAAQVWVLNLVTQSIKHCARVRDARWVLSRVNNAVLQNSFHVQVIIQTQWFPCWAFFSGKLRAFAQGSPVVVLQVNQKHEGSQLNFVWKNRGTQRNKSEASVKIQDCASDVEQQHTGSFLCHSYFKHSLVLRCWNQSKKHLGAGLQGSLSIIQDVIFVPSFMSLPWT